MAATDVMQRDKIFILASPFDLCKGDASVSRGISIEKKIELLENLTGHVSNRHSRRWLNDRLLMELVPRLNAEEIRGLFAPPPWGDDVPPSTFSLTNAGEWDKFRNIDMDKEAKIIDSLNRSSVRRKSNIDEDKVAVLNAWRRIDCRTREAFKRCFLPELIEGYENCIRHFIEEGGEANVLELKVQDPFHRLLLHGVCEPGFCNHDRGERYGDIEDNEDKEEEGCEFSGISKNRPLTFPENVQGRNVVTASGHGANAVAGVK